jgi:hypothetical protein
MPGGPTVLVIDNYDSFTYNLVQELGELGAHPVVFRNDAITVDDAVAMAPDLVVISPVRDGPRTPGSARPRSRPSPAAPRCSASASAIRPSVRSTAATWCVRLN